MGVYDQAARYAMNTEPHAVVNRLMRGARPSLRFAEWSESRAAPSPGGLDRMADRVAVLADDSAPATPWLLVVELQSRHDEAKLETTLVEVAQLRATARHGADGRGKYNVLAALVYLRDECPAAVLDMTLTPEAGTRHAVLVWNVARDSASAALDDLEAGRTTWGILFWVPLMEGGGEPALIQRWLRLAGARIAAQREGLLSVATVFAELAGRGLVWRTEMAGTMWTESPIVNEWMDQAAEKARYEERREHLLDVVGTRFPGAITPEVVDMIKQQPSLPLLKDWIKAALTAASYDDFLAVLRR